MEKSPRCLPLIVVDILRTVGNVNAILALILCFLAEFDRFLGRLYHSG